MPNYKTASTYMDAMQAMATQVTETPDSILSAVSHVIAGQTVWQASASAVTNAFAYDGFVRQTTVIDGRGNTALMHYNALGQVDYVENAAGNRTAYGYDDLGRKTSVTDALTNTVHTAYDNVGNAVSVWGATYPAEYDYDTQGRKVSMKTFRDEQGAGDETRWLYDQATGLLTNKLYADGLGPNYTYTTDGKLASRTWARGVEIAYAYDSSGSLTDITYSDATPDVVFTYDRMGRMVSATSTVSTNLFFYDGLNLATETQNGVTINRATDNLGRQAGFGLGTDYVVQYGYDDYGRFHSVSSSVQSVSSVVQYSYLNGSGLLAAMTNAAGFSWMRRYESQRDLITSVENRFDAALISHFDYANDALARRTRRVDNNSVTNDFDYNVRSEVTGAQMGTNGYSYAYDPIGNRLAAANNAEGRVYLANPLNQYTNIFVPSCETSPIYDPDGNLLTNGAWYYAWDGENRLIKTESLPSVPDASKVKVENLYGYMGRRSRKLGMQLTQPHTTSCGRSNVGDSTLLRFVLRYDGRSRVGAGGNCQFRQPEEKQPARS